MILWLGIGIGWVTGLGLSKWRGHPYHSPVFNHLWLVFLGFLPQFLFIHVGRSLVTFPDWLVAMGIVTSQLLLLGFAWLNRHLPGMLMLIVGLVLNLAVIVVNGGFMPINPNTAEQLVGTERIASFEIGNRIGDKDILLHTHDTHLEWLADRFLLPAGFPYKVAFSLGDIFVALGAFWILAYQKSNT